MRYINSIVKTLIIILPVVLLISGCAALNFATLAPQKGAGYHSKIFNKDITYCRDNTMKALEKWSANVYKEGGEKYIVAEGFNHVFKSCIDTTQVDIFFNESGPGKTEVGVSSLNYQLSAFVAEKLFTSIENPS